MEETMSNLTFATRSSGSGETPRGATTLTREGDGEITPVLNFGRHFVFTVRSSANRTSFTYRAVSANDDQNSSADPTARVNSVARRSGPMRPFVRIGQSCLFAGFTSQAALRRRAISTSRGLRCRSHCEEDYLHFRRSPQPQISAIYESVG